MECCQALFRVGILGGYPVFKGLKGAAIFKDHGSLLDALVQGVCLSGSLELLIIKSCGKYLRAKQDDFLLVNLDKASVYPMGQFEQVKAIVKEAQNKGIEDLCIKKLVLTEKDL